MRKHSPCQVIFSVPYTFTTVLFSDSVLGPSFLVAFALLAALALALGAMGPGASGPRQTA